MDQILSRQQIPSSQHKQKHIIESQHKSRSATRMLFKGPTFRSIHKWHSKKTTIAYNPFCPICRRYNSVVRQQKPKTIERKLQKATIIMHDFANKWGMKINANKTNYIILQKIYKTALYKSPSLSLKMNNTTILKNDNPILLGITLDTHLTFDKHFQDMHKSLAKKLHLIRLLSSKKYNTNTDYLITIYKAFILSKIQYSMLPFTVATKSTKDKLQILQNKTLKRILKVSQKTPTNLIHTLANTQPLNTRIRTLLISYCPHK